MSSMDIYDSILQNSPVNKFLKIEKLNDLLMIKIGHNFESIDLLNKRIFIEITVDSRKLFW